MTVGIIASLAAQEWHGYLRRGRTAAARHSRVRPSGAASNAFGPEAGCIALTIFDDPARANACLGMVQKR